MTTRHTAPRAGLVLALVVLGLGPTAPAPGPVGQPGASDQPPVGVAAGIRGDPQRVTTEETATSSMAPGSSAAPEMTGDLATRPPLAELESTPIRRPLPTIPKGAVPILYYHRAQAPPPAYTSWSRARQRSFIAYDVLPVALEAQLDWLVAQGYSTILPRDLVAHWTAGSSLPPKPVILTFDDGFHDWATTILPMLRTRHMVAEFYLTLDAIRSGAITWREVRMLAAAGNGIGAHDVHHVQLAGLGSGRPAASPAVMWAEVSGARRVIAAHVGIAPDSMAYVGGGFNPDLERLVQKAGYTTARSIRRGIVQTVANRFELRVVRIGPKDDVTDLMTGSLVPDLPTFAARMHGVSDR